MALTREEFKTITKVIRGTYSTSLINSQTSFDLWYEMLCDMDYKVIANNLKDHIKTNKFAPTIAELRRENEGANRFNNFLPRGYDMNKLELALLERCRPEISGIAENSIALRVKEQKV